MSDRMIDASQEYLREMDAHEMEATSTLQLTEDREALQKLGELLFTLSTLRDTGIKALREADICGPDVPAFASLLVGVERALTRALEMEGMTVSEAMDLAGVIAGAGSFSFVQDDEMREYKLAARVLRALTGE